VNRGEFYLVRKPGARDPKRQRVFLIVSRKVVVDSNFSTVICAPVYSRHDDLSTQVRAGIAKGLKHESSVHCDELVSVPKSLLTHFRATPAPLQKRRVEPCPGSRLGVRRSIMEFESFHHRTAFVALA
jgi:mRNA interferase MazF